MTTRRPLSVDFGGDLAQSTRRAAIHGRRARDKRTPDDTILRRCVRLATESKDFHRGLGHFVNRLPDGGERIAWQRSHWHIVITDNGYIAGHAEAEFPCGIDTAERHHVAREEKRIGTCSLPQ